MEPLCCEKLSPEASQESRAPTRAHVLLRVGGQEAAGGRRITVRQHILGMGSGGPCGVNLATCCTCSRPAPLEIQIQQGWAGDGPLSPR